MKGKRRKIGRGKPLEELTKGSHDYLIATVRAAFRAQFPRNYDEDDVYNYVEEVFDGYVIVQSGDLAVDEYYYVTFTQDGEGYTFAARDDWEVVELTYKPKEVSESRPAVGANHKDAARQKRFVERVGSVELLEAEDGKPRRIKAVGLTADVVNENRRRYSASVVRAAVDGLRTHLHESAGQGRAVQLLGEAEHPAHKPTGRPNLLETVVNWEAVDFDGSQVLLEGTILSTSKGKDILALMEGGVMPGVSQRAYGDSKFVGRGRDRVEEVTELVITGYDLVLEPSDPTAGVTMFESEEENEMDPEEILKALQESGFFDELNANVRTQVEEAMRSKDVAQKETALREALGIGEKDDITEAVLKLVRERKQPKGKLEEKLRESLGMADTDNLEETLQARLDRLANLEEAEQKRKVAEYVEKEIEALTYPVVLKEQLAEALGTMELKTIDEAKATIVAKRQEYDAFASRLTLAAKGFGEDGLRVLGPVLERETGVPEYARAAFQFTEALVRQGMAPERNWNEIKTVNERFAVEYLRTFDELYKGHLLQESRLFEETSMQVSDLNLPYSVARAIVAEAFPRLIATSIFDVQLTDQAPSRVYYEAYGHDNDTDTTVTDEDITSDEDAWVDLDYARIIPGTITVEPNGGGTAYVEGTDYAIDYVRGRVWTIAAGDGGSIGDSTALDVTYNYRPIRLGELAAIKKGKGSLSYKTVEIAADRLATQISSEAIVFSRSQLGWDAVARTLMMLVREIQRKIDQGLMYNGLSAALIVASNSGGTWASSTDTVDTLVKYIGYARVKVSNRYYDPTFVLLSVANADRLSNWDGFSAAGKRPDADLNANGYVGRVKGLGVFESTEFSDSYVLVGNRELVQHRIFQPMQLKGPYPTYSSDELVAADQYFAEEYNGTEIPVPEKGAVVKVS